MGWHGVGPTRLARHMGGDKPYLDGGGLCSPGKWPPNKRWLPKTLPLVKNQVWGTSARQSGSCPGAEMTQEGS